MSILFGRARVSRISSVRIHAHELQRSVMSVPLYVVPLTTAPGTVRTPKSSGFQQSAVRVPVWCVLVECFSAMLRARKDPNLKEDLEKSRYVGIINL